MGTFKMATARFGIIVRQFSSSTALRAGQLAQAPIQVFGIEGRYAHALYSAATKQKKLDAVEKDLNGVHDMIKKDANLAQFIADPTIKRTEKRDAIDAVLKKQKADPLTINLFGALAENGRLNKLNSVVKSFGTIMSAHRGEVICTVTTAKPLEANHLKELKTALQGFLKKGETLQLSTEVDPSLIGGMRVTIGDKYVDMSMATRIKTYSNLIKQGV